MIIIPAGDRSTEGEVSLAVIAYLRTCAYGEADFNNLRFNVPRFIKLTAADKEVSRERDAELKWHTVLRNIGAHANQPGNAIHDGLLVKRRGGGYQLAARAKASA